MSRNKKVGTIYKSPHFVFVNVILAIHEAVSKVFLTTKPTKDTQRTQDVFFAPFAVSLCVFAFEFLTQGRKDFTQGTQAFMLIRQIKQIKVQTISTNIISLRESLSNKIFAPATI